VSLWLYLAGIGALPLPLAFVAQASLQSVVATELAIAGLLLVAVLARRRGTLSPSLRASLVAFALCAAWSFAGYTLGAVAQAARQEDWWAITRAVCKYDAKSDPFQAFLVLLCPPMFLLELLVNGFRLARTVATFFGPVLYTAAALAFLAGSALLVRHAKGVPRRG
jgi:hypothetical protein